MDLFAKAYEPLRRRGAALSLVGGERLLQAAPQQESRPPPLRHQHAAAQRHRRAAPRPRHHRDARRHHDPLPSHARRRDALGPRRGPRRHRHADRGRARAGQRRHGPPPDRARGLRRARLGLGAPLQEPHPGPAPPPRRLLRLGARALHAGRGADARRPRGLRAPLRGGAGLSRRAHHQLVSGLPERDLRPRSRDRGHAGHALLRSLSAGAARRRGAHALHHRGDDAPGDDPGRHRRRRQSQRRALPRPRGPLRHPADHEPAHPDRRRRGG